MSEADAERAAASGRERHRLVLGGAVQGVGFRPFVLRLARELSLAGWAQNTGEGLRLEVEGGAGACAAFAQRLFAEAPAHAAPRLLSQGSMPPTGESRFEIRASSTGPGGPSAELLPDLATCADCLGELFDPGDRRHLHPFINCTQCGPRYSIALALPYDRERTTMRSFAMCPACRREYEDPGDRRFHAQPIACHECGPHLVLADPGGTALAEREAALEGAALAIESGQIVALKGIGGFHLLADARSPEAVARLRRRKRRPAKPLAVMMPGLDAARLHCELSECEETLLASPAAPIVLLRQRAGSSLADGLAPGNPRLGVLLPYSPLHHLLLRRLGFPLVATSGNLSGEVLCTGNEQALARLGGLGGPEGVADLFLLHDRPIARPADDSVLRVVLGRELFLRRGRGGAPATFAASGPLPPLLAAGGDLKGALALAGPFGLRGGPHLGDLGGETAQEAFLAQARELPALAGIAPQAVACDLHPEYHSTRLAERLADALGVPLVRVPHHHAHLAACLAEHGLADGEEVLGVIWDGSGYGPDGTVWGGEFLLGSAARCERFASLRPFPLPGGDLSARQPRYAALGLLHAAGIPLASTPLAAAFSPQELAVARAQLERGLHAPLCTSAGRLFDAVAALLGLRLRNEFEAQAAMDLEFAADRDDGGTGAGDEDAGEAGAGFALREGRLDWEPVLRSLLEGLGAGLPVHRLAARFHRALRDGIVLVARAAGKERVVLGGGCFQNARLLASCVAALDEAGFEVLWPRLVPPNDGGLALGQAFVAARLVLAEAPEPPQPIATPGDLS